MNNELDISEPAPQSAEFIKKAKAIHMLPGKIIGWDEHNGVHELVMVSSGSEDKSEPVEDIGISKRKFELERNGEENYMRFSFVARHLRWLLGEVLTIADATIEDPRKLKATKDLIKDKFSSKISWIYENCGCPEDEQSHLDEPED